MDTEKIKKDLKKICKHFRDKFGGEYPKAVMTTKQMELKTGSINCGYVGKEGDKYNYHYHTETVKKVGNMRDKIVNSNEFKNFVTKYNIKYDLETTSFHDFIIRIRY